MSNEETGYAAEANDLYWNDMASVSEIANRFGISRRALYDIIEPRPAGVSCPSCAVEVVFVNRSAVASRTARCLICEVEIQAELPDVPAVPGATSAAEALVPPSRRLTADRRVSLGGAALLGAAIGSIAVLLLFNRD